VRRDLEKSPAIYPLTENGRRPTSKTNDRARFSRLRNLPASNLISTASSNGKSLIRVASTWRRLDEPYTPAAPESQGRLFYLWFAELAIPQEIQSVPKAVQRCSASSGESLKTQRTEEPGAAKPQPKVTGSVSEGFRRMTRSLADASGYQIARTMRANSLFAVQRLKLRSSAFFGPLSSILNSSKGLLGLLSPSRVSEAGRWVKQAKHGSVRRRGGLLNPHCLTHSQRLHTKRSGRFFVSGS